LIISKKYKQLHKNLKVFNIYDLLMSLVTSLMLKRRKM